MSPPVPRLRRPPNLRIDTQRVEVSGGETHKMEHLVGEYLSSKRQRRLRQGEAYMRRCILVFAVSFLGVTQFRQYSHLYYLSWIATYFSFLLTLPSVLPTDNTKIRYTLVLSLGIIGTVSLFCGKRAVEKHRTPCLFLWWLCAWNKVFWSVHSFGAGSMATVFFYSNRLAPVDGLHLFWKANGCYFLFVAAVSAVDLSLSYKSGKYDLPAYTSAGRWNVVITASQAVIGCLCLSHKFKNFMWAYAASVCIQVREIDKAPPYNRHHRSTEEDSRGVSSGGDDDPGDGTPHHLVLPPQKQQQQQQQQQQQPAASEGESSPASSKTPKRAKRPSSSRRASWRFWEAMLVSSIFGRHGGDAFASTTRAKTRGTRPTATKSGAENIKSDFVEHQLFTSPNHPQASHHHHHRPKSRTSHTKNNRLLAAPSQHHHHHPEAVAGRTG